MKAFSLIDSSKNVHFTGKKKVLPASEFSELLSALELTDKIKENELVFEQKLKKQAEKIKEEARVKGFAEGLEKWNKQLIFLEKELIKAKDEIAKSIVPLAMTAVKKILGKELEQHPAAILDIVVTALRPVSQHKKVTIYVNKADLELIEENRGEIKKVFENLTSLSISARDDVQPKGCIIETEAGIINAQFDNQMDALEAAFRSFFEKKERL